METRKRFPRVIVYITLLIVLLAGVSMPVLGKTSVLAAPMSAPVIPNCPTSTIDQWTFTNTVTSSTGLGVFSSGAGVTPLAPSYSFLDGTSIYFSGWSTSATNNVSTSTDYLEFQVDTSGQDGILFNFSYRATSSGPTTLDIAYFDEGASNGFINFSTISNITRDSAFHSIGIDLSAVPVLANNNDARFRIYAYGGGTGNFGVDDVTILDDCILPFPGGSGSISIENKVNGLDTVDSNVCATVVFTLAVTNNGASPITNVLVQDILPVGYLEYVSHTSGMKYYPQSGIWWIDSLAGNTTETLTITAKVMDVGLITNSAEVLSPTYPINPIDSDASAVNSISGNNSDLKVEHDWTRSTSAADTVNLVITVSNNGPDPATGVQVLDKLPSGLTYVSYTTVPSGMTYNSSSGIWTVGNLDSGVGNERILTIIAKVDEAGASTDNVAKIYNSNQCDLNIANNEITEEVLVADLSLTETVDVAGSNAVFTITVKNNGPDDANNITIKNLTLATNYTYVSNGITTGTYNNTTGDWTIPLLLDGDSATLIVTTTYSGSLVVNWAQISAVDEVDPDSLPNNCSGTISTCSEDDDAGSPAADLYLTQSVNNSNPNVGDNVVFSITAYNAGIAGTTNVQVKSILPSGLTYVTNDLGTDYNKSTGLWTVGTLDSGTSKTLNITATVSAQGIRTNSAEIWKSDQDDPDSTPANASTSEDDDATATITSYRSIIINEVSWVGTAASVDDEWIELYNPSGSTISLTGWTLKSTSGSINIALTGSISSGGYFLLERDDNSTVSDVLANQLYTGAMSDSGEILTLRDASTRFIDTANGDGGSWPKGSFTNYASMERQATTAETDSVWVTNTGFTRNGLNATGGDIYGTPARKNSTGITPTATATYPPPTAIPPVGRPVINEFLARPGFDWNQDGKVDVFDEFIEVKNIGVVDINIGGWILDDEAGQGSNPFVLPSINLKPGQHAIFYGSQTNILLSDGGDTVRLLNSSSKVYDAYTYAIAKFEDQSVCRLPDGNGSWYEDCVPTPNRLNSREGEIPSMPEGEDFESPVCDLPDTLPADFLFAECRGYGADIWRSFFWDQFGWQGAQDVRENTGKWQSFIE